MNTAVIIYAFSAAIRFYL